MLRRLINKNFFKFSTQKIQNLNFDVVVIGGNSGSILTRNLYEKFNNRYSIYLVFKDSQINVHTLNANIEKDINQYQIGVKTVIPAKIQNSDGIPATKIDPKERIVYLKNGNQIKYKQLVVATGLESNLESVSGLREALLDNGCPVFAPNQLDLESFKKKENFFYFSGGKSYFYIPPFPCRGEINEYNFLNAFDYWKSQNPEQKIDLTIINANDRFVQFNDNLNNWFKSEVEKRGIKVIQNSVLEQVDKEKRVLKIKSKEGLIEVQSFNNLFSLIPLKVRSLAGLGESLLDVDQSTLQHREYENIFGLGDICNLPTVRSLASIQSQVGVVENNIYRNLTNQYLNGIYTGFTKIEVPVGLNRISFAKFYYEQKSAFMNLSFTQGYVPLLRNYLHTFFTPFFNTLYYRTSIYKGQPNFWWSQSWKEFQKVPEKHIQKNSSLFYQPQKKTELAFAQYGRNFQPQENQNTKIEQTEQINSSENVVPLPKKKRGRPKKDGSQSEYQSE